MLRVGVIGYGYWGPNLVRNFTEASNACVTWVADPRAERLALVASRYPSVKTTLDPDELVCSPEVDAVVIATPVATHCDLALRALASGKHVLVEKPLAHSTEAGRRIVDEAARRGLTLMVDHTFPYTGAVRKIKQLVDEGRLGDFYYYDSVRVNLGLFQRDVSVVWDLAVHDLAILEYLLPQKPLAVSATGVNHVSGQYENIAYLTLFYPDSAIAHVHVNWLAPVKLRQTLIGGSKNMIVYDDLQPAEKVKVYDKGVTMETDPASIYELRVGYRAGDMWAPKIDGREALRLLAEHFVRCVQGTEEPLTGGEAGLRVVQTMEAATRSMAMRGTVVDLNQERSGE